MHLHNLLSFIVRYYYYYYYYDYYYYYYYDNNIGLMEYSHINRPICRLNRLIRLSVCC